MAAPREGHTCTRGADAGVTEADALRGNPCSSGTSPGSRNPPGSLRRACPPAARCRRRAAPVPVADALQGHRGTYGKALKEGANDAGLVVDPGLVPVLAVWIQDGELSAVLAGVVSDPIMGRGHMCFPCPLSRHHCGGRRSACIPSPLCSRPGWRPPGCSVRWLPDCATTSQALPESPGS